MNPFLARVLLVCSGAFWSIAPAWSQVSEAESETPKRRVQEQGEVEKSSRDASQQGSLEANVEPSFEQVLEAPEDVRLNIRFARSQISRGDLRGAATTLERILMMRSDLPHVRLLYGIVLYQLGDISEAEREFDAVKAMEATGNARAEAESYLRLIERDRRNTHFDTSLSMGFDLDSNRNASPASGQRLLGGIPVSLAGSSGRKEDTSGLLVGRVYIARNLPGQSGHQAFADLSLFRQEQTAVDFLDMQAYALRLGGLYRTRSADFIPTAEFDHLRLSEKTFLRSQGGGLRAARRMASWFESYLDFHMARQDYTGTTDVPAAADRSGKQVELGLGGTWRLNRSMNLTLSYTRTEKGAIKEQHAFSRDSLGLAHSWGLWRGGFLLTSLTVNLDRYKLPDVAVSAHMRHDDTLRARVMLGVPMSLLAAPLRGLIAAVGYEYYHAVSTLTNYAYDNGKASALAIYRWGI